MGLRGMCGKFVAKLPAASWGKVVKVGARLRYFSRKLMEIDQCLRKLIKALLGFITPRSPVRVRTPPPLNSMTYGFSSKPPFFVCDKLETNFLGGIRGERFNRSPFSFLRCMDVASAGLNRAVSQDFLDRKSISASVGQPCACRVPKIVKSEIFDPSLMTSGIESLLGLGQIQTRSFADEDEFAAGLRIHLRQFLPDDLIHRDNTVFSVKERRVGECFTRDSTIRTQGSRASRCPLE